MNRLFACLIFILFPYWGGAQIITISNSEAKPITFFGKIVDAETGEPLAFSQINHIYKLSNRDSMIIRNLIADKDGKFEFQSPRVVDNRIEIICLGYKIFTRMLSEAGNEKRVNEIFRRYKKQPEIYHRLDLGILKLTPDVQHLEEVVVKTRIELFRREGDTLLVFPKNIKQFEGDALIDLLKRHPNFRVDEQGNLFVDGKKIERAMVNNKLVFGEEVKTMVHSIMAKEAGLIKVYDEIDETSEILKGKEFARKRKVMNVITFKDFNMFKGGGVQVEAGLYTEQDKDGKHQTMHDVSGSMGQYATNFRVSVDGNTKETAFPQRVQKTGAGFKTEVSSPDLLRLIGTHYVYDKDEREQQIGIQQLYFPTTHFESQVSDRTTNIFQDQKVHKVGFKGKYIEKSVFSLQTNYRGSIENADHSSYFISNQIKDGEQLSYLRQTRESSNRNYNHEMSLQVVPSLKKWGSVDLQLVGTIAKKSDEGIRLDTSYSLGVANQQLIYISGNNPNYKMNANLMYNISSKKGFLFSNMSSFYFEQSDQRDLAVDHFTGKIDSVITRDQRGKNLKFSNWVYGSLLTETYSLSINLYYKSYKYQWEEYFPENLKIDKRFHTWSGGFGLQLLRSGIQTTFQISDNSFPISYLSTRLRDENPMNLNMGNPNLKMGKDYALSFDFNVKRMFFGALKFKIVTDPVLFSRRYFEINTLLPEYNNYEALAGAVLTTPINARSYNSLRLTLSSNSKRGAVLIKSTLDYTFENPETDLLGEISRSNTHRVHGDLSLISNFSYLFRLDIINRVSYNHTRIKAEEQQRKTWVRNSLTAKASLNLFSRMRVNADYTSDYNYNSQTKRTNHFQTLNASMDYRIFSNRRGVIGLNAYNLLNTRSNLTTMSTDLYIQNTFKPENSTHITLFFQYKFGLEE